MTKGRFRWIPVCFIVLTLFLAVPPLTFATTMDDNDDTDTSMSSSDIRISSLFTKRIVIRGDIHYSFDLALPQQSHVQSFFCGVWDLPNISSDMFMLLPVHQDQIRAPPELSLA